VPISELKPGLLENITLTADQEKALAVVRRLVAERRRDPAVGCIEGFAGTGKTTMLKVLAQVLGELVVVTPTGKAALRVREATGLPASTIHKWLYKAKKGRGGEVEWTLKEADELKSPGSGLLVVDEASMVDAKLWADIYEACQMVGCNVLCVGDPFQLPPVTKVKDDGLKPFSLVGKDTPADPQFRARLTEVLRQAQESPIIRASMKLRSGDWFQALMDLPRTPEAEVFAQADATQAAGGVIICHKNASRHQVNRELRKRRGLEGTACPGEPLLVLRNNYDVERFNGEIVTFGAWEYLSQRELDVYDTYSKSVIKTGFGRADVEGDTVILAVKQVAGEMEGVAPAGIEKSAKRNLTEGSFLHANFGYCLTAHKAQGSEWPEVLVVVEPSVRADSVEGRRWLYTAVTRASEKASIAWGIKLA
jgi:exodeoxyribonuclease V